VPGGSERPWISVCVKPVDLHPEVHPLTGSVVLRARRIGATDADRAKNYLFMRYPGIYSKTFDRQEHDFSLRSIDTKPSDLSGTRKIVDVILRFSHRKTDVTETYFVRVDVTEEFPFLVSKLVPYFDR